MDTEQDRVIVLSRGLAGYVRAVAAAVGVPGEGTESEISDTATAYLGLARRCAELPDRDLMLLWSEQVGWHIAVETDPGETPMVLAYFGGDELVPGPESVARFVTEVVAGARSGRPRPAFGATSDRGALAERLSRYLGAAH